MCDMPFADADAAHQHYQELHRQDDAQDDDGQCSPPPDGECWDEADDVHDERHEDELTRQRGETERSGFIDRMNNHGTDGEL